MQFSPAAAGVTVAIASTNKAKVISTCFISIYINTKPKSGSFIGSWFCSRTITVGVLSALRSKTPVCGDDAPVCELMNGLNEPPQNVVFERNSLLHSRGLDDLTDSLLGSTDQTGSGPNGILE